MLLAGTLALLGAAALPAPSCSDLARLASPPGGPRRQLRFWNASDRPIDVAWVGFDSRLVPKLHLPPGGEGGQTTFVGHLFVALDHERCLGITAARTDADLAIDSSGFVDAQRAASVLADLRRREDSRFVHRRIAGFDVRISKEVLAHPDELEGFVDLLSPKLFEARELLHAHRAALDQISWQVDWADPGDGRTHYDPADRRIVVTSLRHARGQFATAQPMVVVHELAHGVRYLGVDEGDGRLLSTFRHAQALPGYLHSDQNGHPGRAYALENPEEYFAESTEAYFGYNDWGPHDAEQLQADDPQGFALMEGVWGPPPERPDTALEPCGPLEASPAGRERTLVRVRNETDAPVRLDWIDFKGLPSPRGELAPGAFVDELTTVGHRFRVMAADRCLGTFAAESKPRDVTLVPPGR